MARLIKLPPELKDWKVDSLVKSDDEGGIYKVVKENEDGETTNALLRVVSLTKDNYSEDRAAFFEEEADFVASLKSIENTSVYLDVFVKNSPSKLSCDLYIFTEDLQSLDTVIKQKSFSEEEIVDFGIKMSEILEKLESENIFHGNIAPQNIFITSDGNYKLGGFSDLESKIEGPSFMSPEVYKHEQADFTTDIYSLGIIMYAMCNNGKLPFESDKVNKKAANDKRLAGAAVAAPANGSEKLKSVIVIACQPDNSTRWKNAGNIKNALSSIKGEFSQKKTDSENPVHTNEKDDENNKTKDALVGAAAVAAGAVAAGAVNTSSDDVNAQADALLNDTPNRDIASSSDSYEANSPIESTDVFDDYAVGGKRNNFAAKKNFATQKDYGDYFEDEPVKDTSDGSNSDAENKPENKSVNPDYSDDSFTYLDSDNGSAGKHAKKKGKGKVIAVIAVCAVILAAAGAIGFVVYNNMVGNGSSSAKGGATADTAATASASQSVSSSASSSKKSTETTVPSTSAASSSSSSSSSATSSTESTSSGTSVTSVLGYTYEEAKQTLEAQGFDVEVWGYQYSKYYTEGYVMSQTPEGGESASQGSTVLLLISKGLASEQSSNSDSSSSQSSASSSSSTSGGEVSGDYLFADSSSSYLSSSQVESLSDADLQLAINEIYARHGRIFNDASINAYFNSKSWYEGKYTADEFASKVTFNEYEQKNLQLLLNERSSRG